MGVYTLELDNVLRVCSWGEADRAAEEPEEYLPELEDWDWDFEKCIAGALGVHGSMAESAISQSDSPTVVQGRTKSFDRVLPNEFHLPFPSWGSPELANLDEPDF